MIKKKFEKIEVRVNDEQKKKVKELAARKNMTVSEYVLYRLGISHIETK